MASESIVRLDDVNPQIEGPETHHQSSGLLPLSCDTLHRMKDIPSLFLLLRISGALRSALED